MAKKKKTQKSTDQLRNDAIKDIDERLNGDATPAKKKPKKKAASTKSTKTEKAPKEKKVRKLSGLDHAAQVLAASKEPLNSKTIAERAIAAGWQTSGKTPHATLYAAMIREITKKGKDARFKKADRGLFTINS